MIPKTHIKFLKSVFLFSVTAFGGPSGHYLSMLKIFVDQRKDISEKELTDYNSFCSLLPGASSTQILLLIAHRKGGLGLAVITLFVWVLPAAIFMGSLSILLTTPISSKYSLTYLRFLQPMVVGFVIYAGIRSYLQIRDNKVQVYISVMLAFTCLIFFKSPLIIPIVLIAGGLIARYTIVVNEVHIKKISTQIRWLNLTIFLSIFAISGLLSEISKKNNWSQRAYFNLFENCYRFGSMVFGGGEVMIPIMYEQYVARPTSQRVKTLNQNVLKIDKDLFLSGAGVVRTIPGPVFSFGAFAGGAAMSGRGTYQQIFGILIATVAIFLPSLLLVLFFHPLWEYLHRYDSLISILKGIQASTVAIMMASGLYLSKDAILNYGHGSVSIHPINAIGVLTTLLLLRYRVLSPVIITISFLSLGLLYNYL